MVFDPTQPDLSDRDSLKAGLSEFYEESKEAIIPNSPDPIGKSMNTNFLVDSIHEKIW